MAIEQDALIDYLNAFRRRAKLFVVLFLCVLGIAVAAAVGLPDSYRSTAELRIDLEGSSVDLLEPLAMTNYADQYVRSLEQKVLTYENRAAWLEGSNVYADQREEASENELVAQIGNDITIVMVTTSVIDPGNGREVDLITGFTTSFDSPDPVVAQFIADRVAAGFLAEDRATRTERAAAASEFLRGEIDAKSREIVEIERKLAEFKERNAGALPDMMNLNLTVLERTDRDIELVQSDIRSLQQDKIFRDAQLEQIRRNSASAERLAQLEDDYLRAIAIYGPTHPDVVRIRRQVASLTGGGSDSAVSPQVAELEAELAEARQKYSDAHPDVVSLQRRLAASRNQGQSTGLAPYTQTDPLYLQLRAQVNAIDAELEGLQRRLVELRVKSAETQDRMAGMPQVEREFLALNRDLQTAEAAFDELRQRLTQAQQTESFESGERGARLSLVRSAGVPESPAGPPRLIIVVLGLFLATSLAGAAALGSEALDSTIRGAKDIRGLLQMEPIVAIPIIRNSVSRSHARRQIMMVMAAGVLIAAGLAVYWRII